MDLFFAATLAIRILLAAMCVCICIMLFKRSLKNGLHHHANVDFVFAQTVAMWWYIFANFESWFLQSSLMQTFGIIVWIPFTLAAGRYLFVLWRYR